MSSASHAKLNRNHRTPVAFVIIGLLALLSGAQAAIGEPPATLIADLANHQPRETGAGEYIAADDFAFEFVVRSGLVFSIEGSGVLNERNVAFMADLVAAATGYGASIAGPVADFLVNNLGDLAGRGEAALGVEQYGLVLNVTGEETPYQVEFHLSLQEVPADLFPPAAHSLGPADARYVVREFSDFQCPFCARFASQMMPVIEEQLLARGDVRFEFHHFPLSTIHANAVPAAEAAECVAAANEPDDFWVFHDALFERQRAWGTLGDADPYFVRLADESGLETTGVEQCLEERRYREEVNEAYEFAVSRLGLTGTPTLFVNGYKVQNYVDLQDYLELIELVDAFADE